VSFHHCSTTFGFSKFRAVFVAASPSLLVNRKNIFFWCSRRGNVNVTRSHQNQTSLLVRAFEPIFCLVILAKEARDGPGWLGFVISLRDAMRPWNKKAKKRDWWTAEAC
jgi:hypothetical protein